MKKMIVSLMLILSMFAFAAESDASATVGYVKYDLVTGSNYTAIPVPDAAFVTASSYYAASANKVTSVYRYLPATQKWDGALRSGFGTWSNNFTVASGQPYLLGSTAVGEIVVDGEVVTNPGYNIVTGSNAVMVPLSKSSMTVAGDYYAETGNRVTSVYRYLPATQKWDGALRSGFGTWSNNFSIGIADPHLVGATSAVTWPAAGGKIEFDGSGEFVDAKPKGDAKQMFFGVLQHTGREFTALEVANLTFKAWLDQGTGAAPTTEVLNQNSPDCYVIHYGDIRGTASISMQEFGTWGLNNILNVLVKDENEGLKAFYEVEINHVITEVSVLPGEFGFEDYFGAGGFPWTVSVPSSVEGDMLPTVTKLHQNYPNPFNPTTTIKFDLAANTDVKLNVYNYNGQMVKSLVNGQMNAGYQSVNFDASNLSAGVYYYTLEADNKVMTSKMVLVK